MGSRVLVIEDNPPSLELMTYLLETFSYEPLTATRGDDGFKILQLEKPDLVICDIQLPGLDGYAVALRAKSDPELAAIPLIAVTALAMVGDRDKVLAAGFDGYISKPIDPETFVTQIERYLTHVSRPRQRAPSSLTAAPVASPSYQGTVLVVDDAPVNLQLMQSLLEPLGFNVVTAETVGSGFAAARSVLPALILSDINLAQSTGFELLRLVKADATTRHIPLILITSTYYDAEARTQGLNMGAVKVLVRPIDPDHLLATIRECMMSN